MIVVIDDVSKPPSANTVEGSAQSGLTFPGSTIC